MWKWLKAQWQKPVISSAVLVQSKPLKMSAEQQFQKLVQEQNPKAVLVHEFLNGITGEETPTELRERIREQSKGAYRETWKGNAMSTENKDDVEQFVQRAAENMPGADAQNIPDMGNVQNGDVSQNIQINDVQKNIQNTRPAVPVTSPEKLDAAVSDYRTMSIAKLQQQIRDGVITVNEAKLWPVAAIPDAGFVYANHGDISNAGDTYANHALDTEMMDALVDMPIPMEAPPAALVFHAIAGYRNALAALQRGEDFGLTAHYDVNSTHAVIANVNAQMRASMEKHLRECVKLLTCAAGEL